MLITFGSVAYKNKADRRRKIYELKNEFQGKVTIWIENHLIMYQQYMKEI
jgi:hypothetical protein